jgi:hypothetical protein
MYKEPVRDLSSAVEFDWTKYRDNFDFNHGQDPVIFGENRVLYRDGWMYSLSNVAGPEWPPENEIQKKELQEIYWLARKSASQNELGWLRKQLRGLSNFQDCKSGKLQVYTYRFNEETGERRRETIDLDLDSVQARIDWVTSDLESSEKELKEIRDGEDNGKV